MIAPVEYVKYGWRKAFGPSRAERQFEAKLDAIRENFENRIAAKYDAAGTSQELESYWSQTDFRSANAAQSYSVRRQVRSRARYECYESNTVAKRILNAKANDVVGSKSPGLQVTTKDREFNKVIEQRWKEFVDRTKLVRKLRQLYQAKLVDGEAFAERIINKTFDPSEPMTDIIVSEADVFTNPKHEEKENEADGIFHDDQGNPIKYRRLKEHPGENRLFHGNLEFDDLRAEDVIHWFRADRPGQLRGISEYVSALPLFAELRRYRIAVLTAAETAANFSAVLYSDAPAYGKDPDGILADVRKLPIFRRSMTRLPAGWKMEQLRSEQPNTGFKDLCDSLYQEIGGVTRTPLNIVLGSSRDYNFSSGKMDYQLYYNANDEDREDLRICVLERIFHWWIEEAMMIPGYLPSFGQFTRFDLPHRWIFQEREPIDELKAAQADQIKFNIGHLTDDDFAFREGIDPEEHAEKLGRQNKNRFDLGMPIPERFGYLLYTELLRQQAKTMSEGGNGNQSQESEAAAAT